MNLTITLSSEMDDCDHSTLMGILREALLVDDRFRSFAEFRRLNEVTVIAPCRMSLMRSTNVDTFAVPDTLHSLPTPA